MLPLVPQWLSTTTAALVATLALMLLWLPVIIAIATALLQQRFAPRLVST
jgi:hypothetical protein